MTIRHRIELETTSFVIAATLIGSFFVWRSNQNFQQQFHVNFPIIAENANQNEITSTSNPISYVDTATQISPDGAKKLVMKTTHSIDGTFTYVISVTDGSDSNEQKIFTTKLKEPESMSIPFNTWSPDNKYFFIKKDNNDALVFKATGEPIIASGQLYFDVANSFTQKNIKDTFKEATGWASETLLIINTLTPENTKGSSYWFEVPSKAIIELSTQF